MHGSSSATLRPRQRTFTSCTECRRRKQRCNQAKDRPCNNCSRRYPPVLCTYETSASPPPSHDRLLDLRDGHEQQSSTRNPRPADLLTPQPALQYQQHPSRSADSIVPPTVQSTDHASSSTTSYYASNSAPSSSYAYHPPSSSASRNEYRSASYTAGDVSATQYLPTTSAAGGFLSMGTSGGGGGGGGDDGGYFGTETVAFDDGHEFYGGGGGGAGAGGAVDATQGDWLSGVAHQNGFLGSDGLYYVYDVDGELVRSTRH